MNKWDLSPLKRGYYAGYSSSNRPGTMQSAFATVLPMLPQVIFDKCSKNDLARAEMFSSPKESKRHRFTRRVRLKYINDNYHVCSTDIEALLNLGRRMKIPGYKSWRNACSGGYSQSENRTVDEVNTTTLYRYC